MVTVWSKRAKLSLQKAFEFISKDSIQNATIVRDEIIEAIFPVDQIYCRFSFFRNTYSLCYIRITCKSNPFAIRRPAWRINGTLATIYISNYFWLASCYGHQT